MTITTALSPHVGAEVGAGDLEDPAFLARCAEALRWRGLLLVRRAGLDDEEQLRFTAALGGDAGPVVPVSYDRAEFGWQLGGHTTVLTARRVAMLGGNTEFASTYAAWAELPAADRRRYEGLRVVHPGGEHPLVRHRRDGRVSLLIGATADHVVGMRPAESRALLQELLAWATQLRFCYLHQWEVGDLVAWDSTAILHRALPYSTRSERLLHRTTAAGDEVGL